MFCTRTTLKSLQLAFKVAQAKLVKRLDNFWDSLPEDIQPYRKNIVSVVVKESYPAKEILQYSKEYECDLIVMGAHDKGVINTFLGSITKSVLRRTRIPVLVVLLPEGSTEF